MTYNVFVSAVSSEFEAARAAVASDMRARGLTVRVQSDFRNEVGADTTLDKLHAYIRNCDAVIALVGTYSGSFPPDGAVRPEYRQMLPEGMTRASYTQWEVVFALHYGRRLSLHESVDYRPEKDPGAGDDPDAQKAWRAHLFDKALGRDRTTFSSANSLCRNVLKEDWPNNAQGKPRNLLFSSLGSLFKGREDFLDEIAASFSSDTSTRATAITGTALHGLGGVGKTRAAIEYALRHEPDYSALLFVTGQSAVDLTANLANLAGPLVLNLPEQNEPNMQKRVRAVLNWLETHPRWFLIIDNVDTEPAAQAVEALLAQLRGGHVLITSRLKDWSHEVRALGLDVLKPEAATDLLLEDANRRKPAEDDTEQAAMLAKDLGYLSLALRQAAAYINEQHLGFADYLAEWEKESARLLKEEFSERKLGYPRTVAATWALSFDQLSPEAQELLNRLAFFSFEPIPDRLLEFAPSEEIGLRNQRKSLSELERYCFVTRDDIESSFVVHRLVQQVARDRMDEKEAEMRFAAATDWLLAAGAGHDPQDVRSWPILQPFLPHARSLLTFEERFTPRPECASLLNEFALLLKTSGQFIGVEPMYRRALKINEKAYGPDHPMVATNLNNLASLLDDTNRHAEAEPLFRRALQINEKAYGPDHPMVATNLNNLASLLDDTNRHAEAEPLLRRALQIDEKAYGPDHPVVARDLNNLANLLDGTNRHAEAEPLYRRALQINEKAYGPDHPVVAANLNNLANLLDDTNRHAEAEPLYRRALQIDEKAYRPDHPMVAIRLNNLALLLKNTNRHAEAEPLYRRALQINEKAYGPDHPMVATNLNNLARLLDDTNRHAEAEPLYRRALKIDEKAYGPDHPVVAANLNNLASLLDDTNRHAEAEPLLRRALTTLLRFKKITRHDHPNASAALGNYVRILLDLGRAKSEIRTEIAAVYREAGLAPPEADGDLPS